MGVTQVTPPTQKQQIPQLIGNLNAHGKKATMNKQER